MTKVVLRPYRRSARQVADVLAGRTPSDAVAHPSVEKP
jgi:hypothetical protein